MEVESQLNIGTKFTVSIPFADKETMKKKKEIARDTNKMMC